MFSPEKLTEKRLDLEMSKYAVAKKLGISTASYFAWESGKTQPNQKNLEKLAVVFGVDSNYFEEGSEIIDIYRKLVPLRQQEVVNFAQDQWNEQNKVIAMISNKVEKTFEYRVYERLSAGTGYGYTNDGDYDVVKFDKWVDHDYASWVYGDSMEPTYLNGSVALIKDTGFDYDGAIYAVDWDDSTFIKKVYREKDGLRLVSLNNKYSDKFAPYEDNPRIIGKIIGNFMPNENLQGA
ncbi:MAG: LexA family transcriptional regulator [Streptococcaceae bacterium]|jgi:phage repressor protein C with HTH and peptisase S24 domain|nr:LexA family transcriptional regulator [Streptococcaceae bacterium]